MTTSLDRRRWVCAALLTCFATLLGSRSVAQETTGTSGSPGATTTIDGRNIPNPPQPFKGEINVSVRPTPSGA